jgi:exoribonuclease R
MVHRQLIKALNNENINIGYDLAISNINFYSKMYKKIQRYSKILYAMEFIDDIAEFSANIIGLKDEYYSIQIYIKQIDLEIDVKLINKNISHILEKICDDENELIIFNSQTAVGISFYIFQEIKVRLSKTKDLFNPIIVTVIDPPIYDLLNL